jgi:hypothetical protein
LDEFQYYVPLKAIIDTEHSLLDFPLMHKPDEMLVFWAGIREANKSIVKLVVVPNAKTNAGSVVVSQEANFHFVKALSSRALIQIAQVHTHPTSWAGHSPGDGEYAAFKVKGLLSIVVPSYCIKGMWPLEKCGVHRFDGKKFIRLQTNYVRTHFHVLNDKESELKDLRE